MHAWEAIQVTVDYIEEHIQHDLKIEELSKMANLSQFYYQRLFTRLVKKPVNEYIKLRRLASACKALKEQKRIIDVALEYGFGSHETFTRAFKSTYKITPQFYRSSDIELNNFDKPDLYLNYAMVDENVPIISDGMVIEYRIMKLEKTISFIGVNGYYSFQLGKMLGERPEVSEPALVWKEFNKIKKHIEYRKDAKMIGVSYPGDAPKGYSSYFVGIESNSDQTEFSTWILPQREYLVCRFEVENKEKNNGTAVGRAMKHTRFWLREHNLRADGFFPEIYNTDDSKVFSMELWIPFISREESK